MNRNGFSQLLLLVILAGVLALGAPIIFKLRPISTVPAPPPPPQGTATEPELSVPITRQARIEHVEWTYAHGKQYPTYNIGDETGLIVTYYQWRSSNPGDGQAALLVFKVVDNKPHLMWESDQLPVEMPLIKALDMTGDGKNELLALWVTNGKYEALMIYRLVNGVFTLITPEKQLGLKWGSTEYDPIFGGGFLGATQIADLDKDGIPEVWFPGVEHMDDSGHWIPDSYVAYKWDGSKYFLWRKQKQPFAEYKDFNNL